MTGQLTTNMNVSWEHLNLGDLRTQRLYSQFVMNTELKNLHEQWGLRDMLVMLREGQEKNKVVVNCHSSP